jgi:predicted transcriptional regulator
MNIQDLQTHATLYKVALLLNISPPAVYKWKKSGIPPLRLYQLKEMKPEWFERKEDGT